VNEIRKVANYMPSPWPLAPLSLLTAAATWGLVWYPYRVLEDSGISGSVSSLLTYALGLPLLGWLAWRRRRPGGWHPGSAQWPWLLAIGLSAGWTNLSYVLAVLQGEVMRVLLLFYLAPLWTVLFARLILRERAGAWGWAVTGLALLGAWIMLGEGDVGTLPLPAGGGEWLALSSGIGFALSNVLTRKARDIPIETRSLWVFGGVVLMALAVSATEGDAWEVIQRMDPAAWWLMGGIVLALLLATFTVQYGLSHTPATPAVVILLSELVVAALSSHFLAGERMGPGEWMGGSMIVAATLFTLKLERND
jgi:drug/metabolite transporter (DMT)-like permease